MSRTTHHGARKLTDATRTPRNGGMLRKVRRTSTRHDIVAAHMAGRI